MIIRILFLGFFILFECVVTLCASTLGELGSVDAYAKGFATTADDHGGLESMYKNPAGIQDIKAPQLLTSYSSWFDNSYSVTALGAGLPLGKNWTLALVVPVKYISGIPVTEEHDGQALSIGSFSDLDSQTSVALGYHQGAFSTALKFDYVYKSINQVTGTGFGLGMGVLWSAQPFTFGVSILNLSDTKVLWTNNTTEAIPQEINLGAGMNTWAHTKVLADFTMVAHQNSRINLGGEWEASPYLGLSVGLQDITNSCRFTAGTQLHLNGMSLFYAFSQHSELGSIQKIGIRLE